MHLSLERNLYLILLFFFKKRRLLYIYFSHLFSPFQKDTTFYLYYIANKDTVYTNHFLFNSSSNFSTCCNVSPLIKEKSVVSSFSSLKNHCHNLLSLQSPLPASVGMIVLFYSTLSNFVLNLCIEEKDRKTILSYLLK